MRLPLVQVPVQSTHLRFLPLPLAHALDSRLWTGHWSRQVLHPRFVVPVGAADWYLPLPQLLHAVHDLPSR